LAGDAASHPGAVPAGLAAVLAAAGAFGVRFIHRRGGLAGEAAELFATLEQPLPAADRESRAA
jgi:hypothetical protein